MRITREEKESQRGTAASRPFANSCHLAQVATQKIRKRSSNNNSYRNTHTDKLNRLTVIGARKWLQFTTVEFTRYLTSLRFYTVSYRYVNNAKEPTINADL